MKYLILVLLLTGCATSSESPKKRLTYGQRMDKCITKYLAEGVDADGAIKICKTILRR